MQIRCIKLHFLRALAALALLSTIILGNEHFAHAADAEPALHWIWRSKDSGPGEYAYLRKTFEVQGKVKSATLWAACDNQVSIFLNGAMLVHHIGWERAMRDDVTAKIKEGTNVIALRCQNDGGPAGLLLKLVIETADGKKQVIVSDPSWLAHRDPPENWRVVDYATKEWAAAISVGKWGAAPWGPVALDNTPAGVLATPVDSITTLPGFKVEMIYSVPKGTEGSWVSMTTDPKGRLICSDQQGPLYRVTPGKDRESTKVEKLTVGIGAAQGLLWVDDTLYVTVNGNAAQGSGFYAVRDTNGDDQLDEVKLLKKIDGGGEHGPHAIRLGPDGMLYFIAGNHTKLPQGIEADSPHRNYAEDLLLLRNPDGRGHATGVMAPGGWVVRTDKQGSKWELFCAGFRNQYDIAFNQDGEFFSYDADMEWDTGTPWYRPTRVNHCVSAAEFGWRYGTGKWPDYFVDSVGAVVDIGLGCPTGIEFGTGAKFPAQYQRALFINDWTYGKIYAVHLKPNGASYTATFEPFVVGKPLPVTDVVINPVDRAMYFTIGGRGTQSGVYRVTYTGQEPTDPVGPLADAASTQARALRRKLEAFHKQQDPKSIDVIWPNLNSADRSLRYAARVALENQDLSLWQSRALGEKRVNASIQALVALTRVAPKELQGDVLASLGKLPYQQLTEEQMLDALRVYHLAFIRMGGKQPATAAKVVELLSPLYPAQSEFVNRELCNVLVYLEAPGVVDRSMKLLQASQTQQDQLFYAFVLRNAATGWSPEARKAYFSWLNLAESKYRGGASFQLFIQQIRKDAVGKLSDADKTELAEVIEGKQNVEVVSLETTRQFVHNWQIEDFAALLSQAETGRSFEKGKLAYEATQCAKCHRFKGDGASTGPDITTVGNRFNPLYMLESLITPSKVISDQYLNSVIVTDDGEVVTGRIIEEDAQQIRIRTSPFARDLTEIPKAKIEERQIAKVSEMPVGLLNVLTQEEILDLIAYLRSGGDPNDKAFKK